MSVHLIYKVCYFRNTLRTIARVFAPKAKNTAVQKDTLLYLTRQDIKNLAIRSWDMINSIRELWEGCEEGLVHVMSQNSLYSDNHHIYVSTLSAAVPSGIVAIKSLGLNNENTKKEPNPIGSLPIAPLRSVQLLDVSWRE